MTTPTGFRKIMEENIFISSDPANQLRMMVDLLPLTVKADKVCLLLKLLFFLLMLLLSYVVIKISVDYCRLILLNFFLIYFFLRYHCRQGIDSFYYVYTFINFLVSYLFLFYYNFFSIRFLLMSRRAREL